MEILLFLSNNYRKEEYYRLLKALILSSTTIFILLSGTKASTNIKGHMVYVPHDFYYFYCISIYLF